jgi:dihydrofolate reductase
MISIIAAVDNNGLIGNKNRLPWSLPADMKRFKLLTFGKTVIMGRITFETMGKLLDRFNIVLSRNELYVPPGCVVANSVGEALRIAGNMSEIMVIGGAIVFNQFIDKASRIYLTWIKAEFEGDTYFPAFIYRDWKIVWKEEHQGKGENPPYSFLILERK